MAGALAKLASYLDPVLVLKSLMGIGAREAHHEFYDTQDTVMLDQKRRWEILQQIAEAFMGLFRQGCYAMVTMVAFATFALQARIWS